MTSRAFRQLVAFLEALKLSLIRGIGRILRYFSRRLIANKIASKQEESLRIPPRTSRVKGRRRETIKATTKSTIYTALVTVGAIAAIVLGSGELSQAADPAVPAGKAESVAAESVAIAPGSSPDSLLRQGQARYELGYLAQAAQLWEAAQQRYRSADNFIGEIQAANYLTLTWQNLGRLADAEALNQTVLDRLEAAMSAGNETQKPLMGLKAQALNHRGHLLYGKGQLDQAADTWQRAEDAYRAIADTTGEIGSVVARARALQALGHHHRGQELLETAILSLKDQPPSQIKAIALRGLGEAFQIVGDPAQAYLALQSSRDIAEMVNSPDDVAAAWIDLGHLARRERANDFALKYYGEAINIAASPAIALRGQLNELQTLIDVGSPAAIKKIDPLAADLEARPLTHDSRYGRINLADSWLRLSKKQGQPIQTKATQTKATQTKATQAKQNQSKQSQPLSPKDLSLFLGETVQLSQTLGSPRAEAFGLYHLSRLYQDHNELTGSQKLAERSLVIAQSLGADDIAARAALQIGTVRGSQGDRDGAIRAYDQAIQSFQYLRQDLVAIGTDVQFDFRESIEPAYRQLISLLLQPGATIEEITQARNVIEALQVAELDNFFGDSCLTARPESIESIDPKAAVLYPIFLDDRLDVIVALGDRPLRHFKVNASLDQISGTLEEFYSSLNPAYLMESQQTLGKTIYDWLITPIQGDLDAAGIETLVMVPDGPLRKVPIGAIYDGDRYLVERYQFAISPGLQLLPPTRRRANSKVFIAGLSEARQGFSALPGVTQEVGNISQDFDTRILMDNAFTSGEFLNQLDNKSFPIVHLATHGQFSSSPENTYLLAWSDRLYIQDFDKLFRKRQVGVLSPIDLLVMSACQTAKGDDRATLGLAGFALRSGARSTVASLWSVNDESTAALMTEFYKSLAMGGDHQGTGRSGKAEALRQAQIKLLHSDQYSHPYYWSAFVLIGNWQ
ncbi:MAG: CHAT domain-containing protein [Cyanophyceae cyanobacterium]